MSLEQAARAETLFAVLANDTRLRLLHEVARRGEVCVGDLAAALNMTHQAISNQLQRLLDKKIVARRREGNCIYYRIDNQCVAILLDRMFCLLDAES